MSYKTVAQNGPAWLPQAVVCKVWDCYEGYYKGHGVHTRKIIGTYGDGRFLDSMGVLWDNAEPKEAWEPQEGEWVIAWYDGSEQRIIGKYVCKQEEKYAVGRHSYPCIARLKKPDGSTVALDCTIEELKQRTEWK